MWYFAGRNRLLDALGDLPRTVYGILVVEDSVDYLDVGEKIGNRPGMGFAFHVIEKHHGAAIEVLLQTRELQVGIHLLIGLDDVALLLQPLQRRTEVRNIFIHVLRSR